MYEDIFLDVSKALETLDGPHRDKDFWLLGKWEDKHWMNTPGPLYCGDTDNCGTGPGEAPNNVALDDNARQVIYRQPANHDELLQVMQAAAVDPFAGYATDGNLHWTYATVKGWWVEYHREVEQEVRRLINAKLVFGTNDSKEYYRGLRWWLGYLQRGMYQYLQIYAFFLDNGCIPTEGDRLPEL